MPEPLEHFYHGLPYLRIQRVDETGDEERDAHTKGLLTNLNPSRQST
jgi:hypothetical protein